jgi:hypothetical protein
MSPDQAPLDVRSAARSAQLWFAAWLGSRASLRVIDSAADEIPRARFKGDEFYLPQKNFTDHRAASAHFFAHKSFGGAPFSTARLRPIQIVLVSLFEDARVEQLALRTRPGLRRLWQPYIESLDTEGGDVPALLRRLTQALFDPASPQRQPWIEKARCLFYERREEWGDPALSRELGNWLGNDIGQMRLQFNWKSYVVEPAYRDDHRGLWIDDNDPQHWTTPNRPVFASTAMPLPWLRHRLPVTRRRAPPMLANGWPQARA